jgi:hypothetical protein
MLIVAFVLGEVSVDDDAIYDDAHVAVAVPVAANTFADDVAPPTATNPDDADDDNVAAPVAANTTVTDITAADVTNDADKVTTMLLTPPLPMLPMLLPMSLILMLMLSLMMPLLLLSLQINRRFSYLLVKLVMMMMLIPLLMMMILPSMLLHSPSCGTGNPV